MINHYRQITLQLIFTGLILIWLTGFMFISVFPDTVISASFFWLKQFYSGVCHQNPDKSFEINGIHFLVCARCTGIYMGAFLSSAIMLFVRSGITINLWLLSGAAAVMIIDIIMYSTGIYSYSKVIAFSTGLFSGSTAFIYILSVLEKFFNEVK